MQHFQKRRYVGFPPGGGFVLMPLHPRRAARASLALYEGVEPRQRMTLVVGRAVTALGLTGLLPVAEPVDLDWEWWCSFLEEVAVPVVGPVGHVAIRRPPNGRTCMLFMDGAGRPVGFVKWLTVPLPEFSALVRARLTATPMRSINIPGTLAEGRHRLRNFILFEPLPEGAHRRPPFDPDRIAAIVDDIRERLADVPRPADVPDHHVVCHTGFTPRNVRVVRDGGYWLYDWDFARWGPRMVPEVRYWSADFAYRRRLDVPSVARRIYELLRSRATPEDIHEAAMWSESLQTYRAAETVLHTAIGELAAAEIGLIPSHARR